MDFYRDEKWRKEHPQIAALHDALMPTPPLEYYDNWHILYAKQGETWYCLTRGIWGNPDGFLLSWGKDKEILMQLLEPENKYWFVASWLTRLVDEAKTKYGIDMLAIPVEQWKEK